MNDTRSAKFFLFPVFLILILIFNAAFPELGFKSFAFIAFSFVLLVLVMVPIRWAILLTFTYIGLEGFLKVVSNYHPVIHVGSDVLVILLCVKALVEGFSGGRIPREWPPLALLFALHFSWVLVSLFNPYGLGLVASLAGAKLYVSMVMLFFFGFYQTKSIRDARLFMIPLILVALLHTGFGIYQGMIGEQSVLDLHPRYAIQLEKYQQSAFRPFGLTNLPGGPAVYLAFVFPIVLYFIFTIRHTLLRWMLITFLPSGIFLFLLCQVRSSLLKMIVGSAIFLVGAFLYMARDSRKVGAALVTLTIAISGVIYFLPQLMAVGVESNEDNEAAIERSLSLFDYGRVSESRSGTWERLLKYGREVPFGAGFSRIGAAAGAFTEAHRNDPFYGEHYFFADNFWVTSLVELGIPGMLIMTFILLLLTWYGWQNVRKAESFQTRLLGFALFGPLFAILLGLYGAEGVLYNPDSSFFWFFAGVLMKLPYLENTEV